MLECSIWECLKSKILIYREIDKDDDKQTMKTTTGRALIRTVKGEQVIAPKFSPIIHHP